MTQVAKARLVSAPIKFIYFFCLHQPSFTDHPIASQLVGTFDLNYLFVVLFKIAICVCLLIVKFD